MSKILDVPYYSQLGSGAEYYMNDCLAACFRMVWGYYRLSLGKLNPDTVTVYEFSRLILDSTYDLGGILDVYKLPYPRAIPYKPVSKGNGITIDRIKKSIDNDWPVIALGTRGYIPNRPLPASTGGHFVVVTGYDECSMFIHDPYDHEEIKTHKHAGIYTDVYNNSGYNLRVDINEFDDFITHGSWQGKKYFANIYQGLIHWGIE